MSPQYPVVEISSPTASLTCRAVDVPVVVLLDDIVLDIHTTLLMHIILRCDEIHANRLATGAFAQVPYQPADIPKCESPPSPSPCLPMLQPIQCRSPRSDDACTHNIMHPCIILSMSMTDPWLTCPRCSKHPLRRRALPLLAGRQAIHSRK